VPGGQRLVVRREPVGLVIDDEVAPTDPEYGVYAAAEVAAQRRRGQQRVGQPVGVGGHRVVGSQVRAQHRHQVAEPGKAHRPVAAAERQLEVELG
jgi:hypothetical protein